MTKLIWISSLLVLLVVLLVFVSVDSVGALETKKGTMYYGSDQIITVEWDAVLEATGYQVQLVMFRRLPITIFDQGDTLETSIELLRPRVGQFLVRVRSWIWKNAEETEKQYSTDDSACVGGLDPKCGWSYSDDPIYATVNGQPGVWWIDWQMPSVGGGGID